jgi:hypothetical protein
MAKRIITSIIDDIDGSEAEGVATVRFGLQGESYEIDLSPANLAALTDALAPYIGAARPAKTYSTIQPKRSKPKHEGGDPDAIRAWAASNGIAIGARGRIPSAVRERYEAANG